MSRRPYIRETSKSKWWLSQPRYIRYMAREMSALFIGIYALILIAGLHRLSQGQAEYDAFLESTKGPAGLVFAIVALAFAVYHTFSWFEVTPKAMPLMIGKKHLPGVIIVAAHWIGFVVVSAALWMLVRS
jgi:fumarate reductase subunit C